MKWQILSHRFVAEAINLFVFDEGQIEIGEDFLVEGWTSANIALLATDLDVIRLLFIVVQY